MPDAHHRARGLGIHAQQGVPKLLAAPPGRRKPFATLNLSLLLTNISHPLYHLVCYLEQTSRSALPLLPLSPLLPSACALLNSLAALFPTPVLCFQQLPHSFPKTPGVAYPLPELVRCTEAQKRLFVSPLLATLTHSVSRKSFPCHSYANTRDGGVTLAPVSAFVLVSVQPRTSNLEPLPLRALDTAGSGAYGFAQRSRGNRKLR